MKTTHNAEWIRLDNASKIFPATCDNRDTKVFRISCELYEPVEAGLARITPTMDASARSLGSRLEQPLHRARRITAMLTDTRPMMLPR